MISSGIAAVFITLFTLTHSFAATEVSPGSNSLSELNFNTDENVFLKDLPWIKKDPFSHPSFFIKKPSVKPKGGEVKERIIKENIPERLDLSAILYSEKSKSAVINSRIVRVGSIIKRHKLIEINRDHVKVEFNGKIFKIALKDFIVTDQESLNDR